MLGKKLCFLDPRRSCSRSCAAAVDMDEDNYDCRLLMTIERFSTLSNIQTLRLDHITPSTMTAMKVVASLLGVVEKHLPTVEKLAEKEPKEVEVTLTLTEEEWCEVANALSSKSARIARGEYGGSEENPGDDKKWISTLDAAYEKITNELDKKGIRY